MTADSRPSGAAATQSDIKAEAAQGDRYHYVSVRDGRRAILMTGPYSSHAAAVADVDGVRTWAERTYPRDPRIGFYEWGAASSPVRHVGEANAAYGFEPHV